MAKHLIMDQTGHSTINFDALDPEQLAEANARFMELVGEKKHAAFTRKAGETGGNQIKTPDQQQDETLFVPHKQGG